MEIQLHLSTFSVAFPCISLLAVLSRKGQERESSQFSVLNTVLHHRFCATERDVFCAAADGNVSDYTE